MMARLVRSVKAFPVTYLNISDSLVAGWRRRAALDGSAGGQPLESGLERV